MISYDEALRLTLDHIERLEDENVTLVADVGRTLASDLFGKVDSPSADALVENLMGQAHIEKGKTTIGQLLRQAY